MSLDCLQVAWVLARMDVESHPERYGFGDLVGLAMASDDEIDEVATRRAFMFEAAAGHFLHHLERAPREPA